MRAYQLADVMMIGGYTGQGYPFILLGYVPTASARSFLLAQAPVLQALTVPADCDAVRLDFLLAASLAALAGKVAVAGCTIGIPGFEHLSGGVLGDPGQKVQSAAGVLDKLNSGWSVLTYPGSPGFAVNQLWRQVPPELDHMCTRSKADGSTLLALSQCTSRVGVTKLLALTDGSGVGAAGAALIRNGAKYVLWRLDEV